MKYLFSTCLATAILFMIGYILGPIWFFGLFFTGFFGFHMFKAILE